MEKASLKSCSSLHLQRRLSSGNFSGVTSKAEFHSGQDGTFKPLGNISMWAPCFLMWAVWLLRSLGAPRRQVPRLLRWPPRSLTLKASPSTLKLRSQLSACAPACCGELDLGTTCPYLSCGSFKAQACGICAGPQAITKAMVGPPTCKSASSSPTLTSSPGVATPCSTSTSA